MVAAMVVKKATLIHEEITITSAFFVLDLVLEIIGLFSGFVTNKVI